MYTPYDYQREAIDELYRYWRETDGNGLIVVPTGGGKSFIMAMIIKEIHERWPDTRILILTHVAELIDQDFKELKTHWPDAPAGIFSAGLGRKDLHAPVLFAGIQSIDDHAHKLDPAPEIVLVDECFVGSTRISTPFGNKRIDNMRCGDLVFNSEGVGVVEAISLNRSKEIFTVRLSNEESIQCTGSHPFYTERGWVKARNLEIGEGLFSIEEMQTMWKNFFPVGCCERRKNTSCFQRKIMGKTRMLRTIMRKKTKKSNVERNIKRKNEIYTKKNWSQAKNKRRKRVFDNSSNISYFNFIKRMGNGSCDTNKRAEIRTPLSNLLQSRHWKQKNENSNRAGRKESYRKKERERHEKRQKVNGIRVAGISIEKRTSDELVYNLQVSGSPTYYANGVLVHNCHLIPRKSETRYMKTLHTLKLMYPHLRVVGLTATPYRLDSGWLHKGDGAIFDDIVFDIPIQRLIDAGHLVPVIARRGEVTIDTSQVHKRGGEYIPTELQAAATAGDTTILAVADLIKRGESRKSWLIFTTGCKHAQQVRDALSEAGITAEMILGDTPKKARARYIEEHRTGAIRALVSVDTLTTGYNNPRLDLIANLRPTASPGLWVQMIGRGTRTAPGKENCLLLDYTDNSLRIGPIDAIDPVAPKKGDGTPPAKECPDCLAIIAAGCLTCPYCGHVFPPPAPKIERLPTEAPILKSQVAPERYEVRDVFYFVHRKEGRPDSVRIEYQIGSVMQHREWVFPERTSEKQAFFYAKFMTAAGVEYDRWPKTAAEFINMAEQGLIPKASAISVKRDGKYWTVVGREY